MNRAATEALVKKHEGVRYTVYADTVGHPTIGVGFNLDKDGARARLTAVKANYDSVYTGNAALTEDQVLALFHIDMDDAIRDAVTIVSNFHEHPDDIQSVIVDMIFNLGAKGFSKFKQTIAALEAKEYCTAASQMAQSVWATQVGTRAHENIQIVLEHCNA